MKILHLSTDDIKPGAARAAYRLNKNLQRIGADSKMLVQNKQSGDKSVLTLVDQVGIDKAFSGVRLSLDPLPLKFYPNRDYGFSLQWLPSHLPRRVSILDPDVICLHWICGGYVSIEALAKLKKPIIWTLRDMWPFTGGCHYSGDCRNYEAACGKCPSLKSHQDMDASRWVMRRKQKSWQDIDLTVVALSSWIGECARSSQLFKERQIKVIPNGLDLELFRPIDKRLARSVLRLPEDKHLILFGAVNATSDERKGYQFLQPALHKLSETLHGDTVEVVVFGASEANSDTDFGFKANYLGQVNDDVTLSLIYSAADLLIAPSVQENLANTVLESISCGTPCIAFDIGGMPDLIDHQKNGYLARAYSTDDLAAGITWILEDKERYRILSNNAREKAVNNFSMYAQAKSFLSLCEETKKSS